MFAVPFDQMPGSRNGLPGQPGNWPAAPAPRPWRRFDPDLARRREVVDAFAAAAQEVDRGADDSSTPTSCSPKTSALDVRALGRRRGARAVAERAATFAQLTPSARPALVKRAVGALVAPGGRPFALMSFTVTNGKVVEMTCSQFHYVSLSSSSPSSCESGG